MQLEDRTTPVTISGNTVTLDDPNELLTISTATAGTYTLLSSTDGTQSFTPAVAGPVNVVDSATGTGITFANSTATYANSFAVTLDNAPGVVTFTGASAFVAANSLSVTTSRNILVDTGASVTATNGAITFSANAQATPTAANFIGVDVKGSVTGQFGDVSVTGVGGNTNADGAIGVRVSGGATLGTSIAGLGDVTVTGTGGGSFSTFSGGLSGHDGVVVTGAGSAIISANGEVTVVGDYTAASGQSLNYGVLVSAGGKIEGRAARVVGGGQRNGTVTGNEQDVFILVTGSGSRLVSTAGSLSVERSTTTSQLRFISFEDGAVVSSGGGFRESRLNVIANALNIAPTATVSASTLIGDGGFITIAPYLATLGLNLNDSFNNFPSGPGSLTPTVLGLSDAELDRVTASSLTLGDSDSVLVLKDAITRSTATVQLVGSRLDVAGSPSLDIVGRLFVNVAGTINRAYTTGNVTTPDVVFTAIRVWFAPGAKLIVPPNPTPNPGGGFEFFPVSRLVVNGSLDLTNLAAQTGGYEVGNLPTTPQPGDVLTVATATTLTGTFTGLPDGSTVVVNGQPLVVRYTGTTASLQFPAPPPPPPVQVVTAVGDTVTVLNPRDGSTRTLVPFAGFSVSVASADLNDDGVPDVVVGAGPGGGPHVRVFDGLTGAELASFFAFDPAFRGGVNVAAGSASTTGTPQIVVGAGPGGGPHVKVIDARLMQQVQPNGEIAPAVLLANFFAFDPAFTGGVSVALGGHSIRGVYRDVVVGAGPGGGPHVKVIDGDRYSQVQPNGMIADAALQASFFAFDPAFTGGVNVGATSGRFAVGAGAGGEPQVKTYRLAGGQIEERSEVAFDPAFRGGVRVGFADIDADGDQDLLTGAGPGGGPHLKAFNIAPFTLVRSVFVGDATDPRGVVV